MPAGLEDAFDAEHLLHLVLDGQPVLEDPGHVGADGNRSRALVRQDSCAKRIALARVMLERHELRCLEALAGGRHAVSP
jgi:hypothetical protein